MITTSTNIVTSVQVVVSLLRHKALSSKKTVSMSSSVMKLAARLGVMIVLNIGLVAPIVNEVLGKKIMQTSAALIIASLLGLANNLFFFISDSQTRAIVASGCKCERS